MQMGVGFEGSWWLFNLSVYASLTCGWNLRILSLPFVLLYGTRRTSSLLSFLPDGRVSYPFSFALCRKNCFAWHISTLPRGMIFFHQKRVVHLSWPLCLYPELLAQEKAWVTYSFSSASVLLLCPSLPSLNFTSLWQFVCTQPMGRKPGKNFWTLAHQFVWF